MNEHDVPQMSQWKYSEGLPKKMQNASNGCTIKNGTKRLVYLGLRRQLDHHRHALLKVE